MILGNEQKHGQFADIECASEILEDVSWTVTLLWCLQTI